MDNPVLHDAVRLGRCATGAVGAVTRNEVLRVTEMGAVRNATVVVVVVVAIKSKMQQQQRYNIVLFRTILMYAVFMETPMNEREGQ